MDCAALQRATLERSSAALCWTAWGVREQQRLRTWIVRFLLMVRGYPICPLSGWVERSMEYSTDPHFLPCCNALQVFDRDDDALEAPEQFCSCTSFQFWLRKPQAIACFWECIFAWTAVNWYLTCSGLLNGVGWFLPHDSTQLARPPNGQLGGHHLAYDPLNSNTAAPPWWGACFLALRKWHFDRSNINY